MPVSQQPVSTRNKSPPFSWTVRLPVPETFHSHRRVIARPSQLPVMYRSSAPTLQ